MSNCSACQGEVLRKDKFCGHCGSSIDPPGQEEVANASTPGSRATLKLIAVAVATLAAAALIALVVIVTNNSSQRGRHVAAPPAATPDSVATNDSTPPSTIPASTTSTSTTTSLPQSSATQGQTANSGLPVAAAPTGSTGSTATTPTTVPLISVPDLIGKSQSDASQLVQGAGLVWGTVTPSDSSGVCIGDNTTWNIPHGYVDGWTVRGSFNSSYAAPGSIVDVTVCP